MCFKQLIKVTRGNTKLITQQLQFILTDYDWYMLVGLVFVQSVRFNLKDDN